MGCSKRSEHMFLPVFSLLGDLSFLQCNLSGVDSISWYWKYTDDPGVATVLYLLGHSDWTRNGHTPYTWLLLWRKRFMFLFFSGISNYKNNTELWVASLSSCRESLPKNSLHRRKHGQEIEKDWVLPSLELLHEAKSTPPLLRHMNQQVFLLSVVAQGNLG